MRREYHFWVYILASRSRNLYTGMTSNLAARLRMHRGGEGSKHAALYGIHRLVYFDTIATSATPSAAKTP